MQGKVTLKDLAKLLDFSVSTISKAINDSPEISLETRTKIQHAAQLHHYSPNRLAQSLKAKKTKTLGVIIPEILSHFFAKAIHGIETTASKMGYKVIICLSNESKAKEQESLITLINGSVDGLIMSLSKETQCLENYDHFEDVLKYNLPIVLFDRTTERIICDKVSINDQLAAQNATAHLIQSGCKKVIFLSTISGTSVGEKRKAGYIQEIQSAGFQEYIVNIDSYKVFEHILMDVLKDRNIDGIVAADELSGISVLKYALKHQYKIPQELSVIGFTNGILGENFVPGLTTVDQHAAMQGSLAAEILINRIEKKIPIEPVHRILETTIIERSSTYSISHQKV